MSGTVKNLMGAGVGGTLTYYVVSFIVSNLITGTTTADKFFTGFVPIIVAVAVAWLILMLAFKE